jgi:hypothetical protein
MAIPVVVVNIAPRAGAIARPRTFYVPPLVVAPARVVDTSKIFRPHYRSLPQGGPPPLIPDFNAQTNLQALTFVPPDTTHVLRAHYRSLPDQPPAPLVPAWTWNNIPILTSVVGLPPGEQLFDLSPRPAAQPLTILTASYNLSLIGQDRLPVGAEVTDLAPRGYEYRTTVISWTFSYNLNLIGKDKLPIGAELSDLTPKPYDYSVQLRSWTWSYPLTLIGQDALPNGEIVYELPPRGYEYRASAINWTWSYNLNLIGKDRLPVGEQVTELAPRAYEHHVQLRSWTWFYTLSLIGQDVIPGKTTNEVPRAYEHHVQLRGWTWSYNLNLIGQDQVPGEISYVLPPAGAAPLLQTWIAALNPNLLVTPDRPKNQFDWPIARIPQPPAQSYTASYNLNLIGKDQLPIGAELSDLTPRPYDYRTQVHTWTWSYNLNLIGQDRLPVGEQSTELTPRAYPPPGLTWVRHLELSAFIVPPGENVTDLPPRNFVYGAGQTWIQRLPLWAEEQLPAGEQSTDLPPKAYPPPGETWVKRFDLARFQQLPAGIQVTDLPPRAPQQPAQSFTASYDLNLIGQDQLPNGVQITDLPPRDYERALWLRTWINTVNCALIQQLGLPRPPFNQFDWPLPTPFYRQPGLGSWTASFPLCLIGKDQLPIGRQSTDLTGRPPLQVQLNSFTASFPLELIGKDALPPGTNFTALPAAAVLPPADLRTIFVQGAPYIPPFIPPATTDLHAQPFINASMGRMFGR